MPENKDTEMPEVKRQGWDAEKVSEEAANQMPDETMRQMLRGDKTGEKGDDKDVAGSADQNETPQGREESKNETK